MSPPHAPAGSPFLVSLALWQERPWSEFSSDTPPCDALGDLPADRVLAAAFRSLALQPDETKRITHLSELIKIHTRRTQGALAARPQRYDELRTWLKMVLVLSAWFHALYLTRRVKA